MKAVIQERLRYAAIGGIVIPLSYYISLLALTNIFRVAIQPPLLGWVVLPIFWPLFVYEYFFPKVSTDFFGGSFGLSEGEGLSLLLGNFILYSLLTYLVFRLKERRPHLR